MPVKWWTLDRAGGDLCVVSKTLNSHSASPPPYFTLCNPHPDHSLVSAFGSERIKTIQNRFFELKRHLYFFISFHLTLTCTLSYLMLTYLFSCQSNFIMAYLGLFNLFENLSFSESQEKKSTKLSWRKKNAIQHRGHRVKIDISKFKFYQFRVFFFFFDLSVPWKYRLP